MKSRCFKKQRLFFVLLTNIRTDYPYYFKDFTWQDGEPCATEWQLKDLNLQIK